MQAIMIIKIPRN